MILKVNRASNFHGEYTLQHLSPISYAYTIGLSLPSNERCKTLVAWVVRVAYRVQKLLDY